MDYDTLTFNIIRILLHIRGREIFLFFDIFFFRIKTGVLPVLNLNFHCKNTIDWNFEFKLELASKYE